MVQKVQCPCCGEDTFRGDYDHEFYIEKGKVVCTGKKVLTPKSI